MSLFIKNIGRPVIVVRIPPHEVTSGIIRIESIESRAGKISYYGNKHFSSKTIEEAIHIREDDLIHLDTLGSDLSWLNRNPFRNTDIIFSPGDRPHTTDIEVITKDRFPLHVYAGTDNTGFEETDKGRS